MDLNLADCSNNVWSVPSLRPLQLQAAWVLMDPQSPDQILLVLPTSGGKTHIIRTVGAMERGVVPIFIPLLTLAADVMAKVRARLEADPRHLARKTVIDAIEAVLGPQHDQRLKRLVLSELCGLGLPQVVQLVIVVVEVEEEHVALVGVAAVL